MCPLIASELSIAHPETVFLANLGVGPGFQLLEILQYVCGLKTGSALTLTKNPRFWTGTNYCLSRNDPKTDA